MHSSVHQSSKLLLLLRITRVLEMIIAVSGREVGYMLNRSPIYSWIYASALNLHKSYIVCYV